MTYENAPSWLKDIIAPLVVMALGSIVTGTVTHQITLNNVKADIKAVETRTDLLEKARAAELAVIRANISKNTQTQEQLTKSVGEQQLTLQRWMGTVDTKLDNIATQLERHR